MKDSQSQEAASRMRNLYNNAPFPESMDGSMPDNNVLLLHWIAAAVARDDIGKIGTRDFVVNTKACHLELLRNCDGKRSLSEILSGIGFAGDLEKLRASLYRLYQFGLLGSGAAQTL